MKGRILKWFIANYACLRHPIKDPTLLEDIANGYLDLEPLVEALQDEFPEYPRQAIVAKAERIMALLLK